MKKKNIYILALLCAIAQGAWAQAVTYWTGEGNYSTSWTHTEDGGKTIYIDSEADLARLAKMVDSEDVTEYNNGYQGYTFKLTRDLNMGAHLWVPIGDMETGDIGELRYPFMGVFDGQGHTISGIYAEREEERDNGLFGYVEGDADHKAIITNLKLTNSRIEGKGYCGGIAGFISGNVEVSNIVCEDVVVVGDESVGGIIGQANEGPTVKNCFYKGGGVSGWDSGSTGAIIGGGGAADYEDNYTTYWVRDDETRVSKVILDLPEGVEINWWSTPIKHLDGEYYLPDDAVMVMGPYCTSADGSFPTKRITGLTINGVAQTLGFDGIYRHTFDEETESGKTIAVTAEHLSVSGNGTEGNPYKIYNANDWSAFANAVTNGGNSFAGKFFRLENNLTVPTMVGAEGNPFSGTFKAGTNQTIYNYLTFNCGTEASPYTEDYCAPFRYIDGATIENLKVVGNVYTSGKYAGGIVAVADGEDSHITGCHSSVIIKSIFDASAQERYNAYHGGFVALVNKYLTITGSLFDGAIIADNDEYGKNTLSECGGFVGALGSESAYSHIMGCLVDAEHEQMYNYGYTFVNHDEGNTNFSIENSYYTHSIGYQQGSYAYKVTSQQPANTVSDTYTNYPVSGFAVGAHSLRFSNTAPYTWYVGSIGLYNDDDNTNLLNEFIFDTQSSGYVSVTLSKRTLFKDGSWNTLCLPFDVSAQQIAENKGGLKDATLMALKESSFKSRKLTINFETVTEIEAGKPYIVKWAEGTNITDPVFDVVEITKTEPAVTETQYIDFEGTFSPKPIYEVGDKTKLYLGSDNTLYYPTSTSFHVNAFRGYFKLKNGLTASPNSSQISGNEVKEFVLNFNGETTGVSKVDSGELTVDSYYTIDGVKLSAEPTTKGVYIKNGKKIIIK